MTGTQLGRMAVYPLTYEQDNFCAGITKRELFAAMMMQGLLADPMTNADQHGIAVGAVRCADALLEQLANTEPTGEQ